MPEVRPYQIVLSCNAEALNIEGATNLDITPAAVDADSVIAAFGAAGLSTDMMRSRVMFHAGGDDIALVVATYAAVCGFAGRRVDILVGGDLIDAVDLDRAVREFADAGKPEQIFDHLQLGAHRDDLASIVFGAQLSADDVSAIRFARRIRFVPVGGVAAALTAFIAVAGLRARDRSDRFPYLCDGTEAVTDDAATVVGVCLDTIRRAAVELRRTSRSGDRDALVERVELTDRQARLEAAANTDVEATMAALGARQNAESGLWHCPRPQRHSNGDQNPSMRAGKGLIRCYRCDTERVDSLRLTADVLGVSVDEAADWIVANVAAHAA